MGDFEISPELQRHPASDAVSRVTAAMGRKGGKIGGKRRLTHHDPGAGPGSGAQSR
ncbi:MAG: hypothetical protein WBW98_18680 [Candidatus Sulfotelmatobacter sp.]